MLLTGLDLIGTEMPGRLSIDDLLQIRYPTDTVPPRLSPNGRSLALTESPAESSREDGSAQDYDARHVPQGFGGSRITVVDIPTGDQWQPFPRAEVSWGGQWSPDGSMLAAYVAMDGPACLGILHLADRRVQLIRQALVRPAFGFELPVWTPDSRSIVLKLWPADAAWLGDGHPTDADSSGIVVFSHDPDSQVDDGAPIRLVTDRYGCDFGVVDVGTNEVRRLAENWRIIGGWRMSPDGTAVAVPVIVDTELARLQFHSDLIVVPLDGSEPRSVARRVTFRYGQSFSWSPDGSRIAFTTCDRRKADGTPPRGRLFVADSQGRQSPLDLSRDTPDDLGQDFEHPRWSATGEQIFCMAAGSVWSFQKDGSASRKHPIGSDRALTSWIQPPDDQVLRLSADGGLPLLLRDPASHSLEAAAIDLNGGEVSTHSVLQKSYVARGGTLGIAADWTTQTAYVQLEGAEHPPEICRLDLTSGESSRLASLNPGLERGQFGSSRSVEYLDADGGRRRASLLLPPDYVEGRQVPMIVSVYGGLMGAERIHNFGIRQCLCLGDSHLYASRGYAVLVPDIPLGPRDPRRGIPRGVLPAVNRVVELGIADPARIGVMGHSYGGYSVLALITQTEMFAAAVCSAGPVNLTSFYGALSGSGDTSWIGWSESGQARLGGSLWESRDAYIENSSLFYLDRVTTPLLLLSGDGDTGAFTQASETFSALRRLGQRVELRNYLGEDHWPGVWSAANLRDVLARTLAWFDEHLRPEGGGAA